MPCPRMSGTTTVCRARPSPPQKCATARSAELRVPTAKQDPGINVRIPLAITPAQLAPRTQQPDS
eukprot:13127485-Alexandrium_andersonii.AAC.1